MNPLTGWLDAGRAQARQMLPRSLGSQLQWMVASSLAFTLVVLGSYTISQQSAQALAHLEAQATAQARGIAQATVEPLVTDKLDELEGIAMQAARLPQVLDVAIFNPQGASLARVARPRGGQAKAVYEGPAIRTELPRMLQAQAKKFPQDSVVVAWHPMLAGSHLGWVRVSVDADVLSAIRERIWLSTLAIGLAAGLASLLLLSRLMAKPMRAIGQARDFAVGLARIEGQKLAQPDGPQETLELGHALNQASLRLFEQRQAIDHSFAALKQQEAALAEANEQLSTIFSLSPDALLSFDVQGHVKFANESFFRMTGLVRAQVIDQPSAVVDELLRSLCAAPGDYSGLEALFGSGQPGPADARPAATEPLRLSLAQPRDSVLEIKGLHGGSHSVSRLLYLRDITHETEVERLKNEFLSTAAHELRTPMTVIHSCVDLMLMRDFEPERRRQLLEIVQRNSRTLKHIVDELLDLAKLESRNGSDFEYDTIDLITWVTQALEDFVAPPGRVPPELYVAEALAAKPGVPVHVDPRKLKQVLGNLLSNAYKYSTEGPVRVRVQTDPGGRGRVGFEVQDHGIGMSPEQLARVGERFYRADDSGQVLGTGLGMSIVQEMVELMKGQVTKASAPGQGSTFGVWLWPIDEQEPGQTNGAPKAQHAAQAEEAQSPVAMPA